MESLNLNSDNKNEKVEKKVFNKEELTSLIMSNAIEIDNLDVNQYQANNPLIDNIQKNQFAASFFVPPMHWNENAGNLIFSDESGKTFMTKSTSEMRTALYRSNDFQKDENIPVLSLDKDQAGAALQDKWNQKNF